MECVHDEHIDSHNIGTCSKCGQVRQFPWGTGPIIILKRGKVSINEEPHKEEKMNIHERHKYYEQHKEEIIADLHTMGRAATRLKWNIPVGGALVSLEKRWLSQEERAAIPVPRSPGRPRQPKHTGSHDTLPRLPQFSNEWAAPVQLKWLEVYDKIISAYPKIETLQGETREPPE